MSDRSQPSPTERSRGPAQWWPPVVALLLAVALAASTARGDWGGHSPLLWFALVAAVCLRHRRSPWARVVFLPAGILFVLWFATAAQTVFVPFLVALLVAYLLDPLVDRLERRMSRTRAIALLALPAGGIFAALVLLLVPGFVGELSNLVDRLPELREPLERLQVWLQARASQLGIEVGWASLGELVLPRMEAVGARLADAGVGLWRGLRGLIDLVSFLVILPVVSFYLLRDFDRLRERLFASVPASQRSEVEAFAGRVDRAVSGYLRGQLLVGVLLGVLFAVGMTLLGMDYALLVGSSAVVLNLIPFIGSFLTAIIAVAVALLSEPTWTSVLKVAVLYGGIQLLDAAIVSPRVMGESLELHPVLVMLALLVAGQFFGRVGVLIAVPAAAALKESIAVWTPQMLELLGTGGPEDST